MFALNFSVAPDFQLKKTSFIVLMEIVLIGELNSTALILLFLKKGMGFS